MPRDYSSISRFGLTEPFNLQVARRQIAYHESIYKFGNNPEVADSIETIGLKAVCIHTCLRRPC